MACCRLLGHLLTYCPAWADCFCRHPAERYWSTSGRASVGSFDTSGGSDLGPRGTRGLHRYCRQGSLHDEPQCAWWPGSFTVAEPPLQGNGRLPSLGEDSAADGAAPDRRPVLGIQAGGAQACAGPFWFGRSCLRTGGHGGCSFRAGDARGDGGPIPVGSGDTSPIAYFCRISGRWCDRRRWRRGRAHLTACTDAPTRVAEPGLSRGLCRLGSPGTQQPSCTSGKAGLTARHAQGSAILVFLGLGIVSALYRAVFLVKCLGCFPVVASLGVLAFSMGAGFSGITVAFTLLLRPSLKLRRNASSMGLRLGSSVAVLMRASLLFGSALSVLPYL